MRMAADGNANVRASTWTNKTTVKAIQSKAPAAGAGANEDVGTTARNGTSVYAKGNKHNARR